MAENAHRPCPGSLLEFIDAAPSRLGARRTEAKARRRRQAALQAPAQPDAAAETLLIRTAPPPDRPGAMEWTEPLVAPFHFENPTPRGNQAHVAKGKYRRRHEGGHESERGAAALSHTLVARRDQTARRGREKGAFRRRGRSGDREDDQTTARFHPPGPAGPPQGPRPRRN